MSLWGRAFPFSALVGQQRMKTALLLNAVNPVIGGVLIRGERGTAKSTAVRALAELLPTQAVVEGCRFGCDPGEPGVLCAECQARQAQGEDPLPVVTRRMRVVELPLNASEDRVVGTIDLEAALREGVKRFEPGVLAQANRNVLYVDEVNLLDDHIVDVLLDAAATGVNVVEREGVSVSHAARFILVGTMNPEEGELRPQLLDRFGLCVDVASIHDVDQRVEIVQQRARWEDDPVAFAQEYAASDDHIRTSIALAIDILPKVKLPRPVLSAVARLSISLAVEGHRADLVCGRAAGALAAYQGNEAATIHHIMQVAEMVYAHRRSLSEAETGTIATLLDRIMIGEGRRAAGFQPAQDITPGKHVSRLPGDESFEDQAAEESCCGQGNNVRSPSQEARYG